MVCERINLKDFYPHLAENDKNPFVDIYLPYNMVEMKRQDDKRPSMVICPGGGYGGCSEREWEPIALNLLPMGFNVFVLRYSCAPHRYPTQLIEVAALFDLINKNADKLTLDPPCFDTIEKCKKLSNVNSWLKELKNWFDLIS